MYPLDNQQVTRKDRAMSIEEYDNLITHCRMLGHEVPFSYCRQASADRPCRKILDCWFQTFDVVKFVQTYYTPDQIASFLAPPQPKLTSLIDIIQRAQSTLKKKDQ